MKTFQVSNDLLDWLDRHFPDACPTHDMTDRQVWMSAGARAVVEALKAQRDKFDRQAKAKSATLNQE